MIQELLSGTSQQIYTTEKVQHYPKAQLLRFRSPKDQTNNPSEDRSDYPEDQKEHNDASQNGEDRWAIWRA